MSEYLKRKIDKYLFDWKTNPDHKPLIIKGARQVGKTKSIENFAKRNIKALLKSTLPKIPYISKSLKTDTLLKPLSKTFPVLIREHDL